MAALPDIALTTVSALLGAWAGAAIALGRFKKERAFDKRLQWYDEAVQALYRASNTLSVAVYSTRNLVEVNSSAINKAWDEHHLALDGLAILVWRGEVYATKTGLLELKTIMDQISSLSRSMPWRNNYTEFTEQELYDWERIANLYNEAARLLAFDVRKHLGLENTLTMPLIIKQFKGWQSK